MQSPLRAAAESPPHEDAPTLTDGVEAWAQLCAAMTERARLDAKIVELTGRVQRSGTIETVEGVTLDTALSLTHRVPRAERSMQLTAADVLKDMDATQRLFAQGVLSWGIVRGIVAEAKRLTREQRAALDARISASEDQFAKMDPDDALDGVCVAVAELRDPRATERKEREAARANFLWAQFGMFDRAKLYSEMDNVSMAVLLTRVDAESPPDDGRTLSQRRADGLLSLATHACGPPAAESSGAGDAAGHGDGSEPADGAGEKPADSKKRPRSPVAPHPRGAHPLRGRVSADVKVLVNLRDVSAAAAGVLQVNAPGCLPTISAALLESLAADATVQAVLMEGGRPLTVARKVHAAKLPPDVRTAVLARDRADRFPGSRLPLEHVHHANRKGEGHHVDFLAGLSNRNHRRVHKWGWKITLDAATGEMTFTRGDRSWTTLPRGTRLRRPPPAGNSPQER